MVFGGLDDSLIGRELAPQLGLRVVLTAEANAWEMGKGMRGDSSGGGELGYLYRCLHASLAPPCRVPRIPKAGWGPRDGTVAKGSGTGLGP